MSEPSLLMGVAAPMLVAGAMEATCAARVRNVPALAARAPAGPTQTITGTSAESSACTISRVASSEPPGVSSSMTTAAAPSFTARSMPARRYSAMIWSTTPLVGSTMTVPPGAASSCAATVDASRLIVPRSTNNERTRANGVMRRSSMVFTCERLSHRGSVIQPLRVGPTWRPVTWS